MAAPLWEGLLRAAVQGTEALSTALPPPLRPDAAEGAFSSFVTVGGICRGVSEQACKWRAPPPLPIDRSIHQAV